MENCAFSLSMLMVLLLDEEIRNLKKFLAIHFEVKDLGNLRYFLGIEVSRSKKGISVSPRKYTLKPLQETRMLVCKPANTPMETEEFRE